MLRLEKCVTVVSLYLLSAQALAGSRTRGIHAMKEDLGYTGDRRDAGLLPGTSQRTTLDRVVDAKTGQRGERGVVRHLHGTLKGEWQHEQASVPRELLRRDLYLGVRSLHSRQSARIGEQGAVS